MFEMISHGDNKFFHLVKIKTSLTTTNGTEYCTSDQEIRTTVWTQKSHYSFFFRSLNPLSQLRDYSKYLSGLLRG
jgi:hypothetical protein